MKTTGVTCPHCGAGFRRLELCFQPGEKGEYRCPVCEAALEAFDGTKLIAYRLTIQPSVHTLDYGDGALNPAEDCSRRD